MGWTKTKLAVTGALLSVAAVLAWMEFQAHRVYPGLAGRWEGLYGFNQRVVLTMVRSNGAYAAAFRYVDVGIDVPVTDLKVRRHAIRFGEAGEAGQFSASIDQDMKQMSGRWREGTNTIPVVLRHVEKPDVGEPLAEGDFAPRGGSELQGYWKGAIQSGGRKMAVTLKIAEQDNGKLRAEMDRGDWGGQKIPSISMTRNGDSVKISFRVLGAFEGAFDRNTGQLAGHWIGGETNPAVFARVDWAAEQSARNYIPANPSDLQGHWRGTLKLREGKLHFVVHIAKLPDGSLSATMDDPDQGQNNILSSSTEFLPPHVSIMFSGMGFLFNGSLKDGKLTGMWRVRGKVHPLTLIRDS